MIIHELYADKIDEVGISKRIYFYCRIEIDGINEWHYFGTDPAEKPPFTADPVNEYGHVQFPRDLDDLDKQEADDFLYEMAQLTGFRREGLTNPQNI